MDEGDTATITVTISLNPERRVVIPITRTESGATAQGQANADYSGVDANVIFEDGGVLMKSFTFMATQDRIDDDDEKVTLGFGTMPDMRVSAIGPTTQTITIGDDDTRGVVVTPEKLTVNEGLSDTYSVVLTSEPTATVTVTPSTGSTEVRLSSALTFTAGNWETSQTISVTALDDADTVSETLTVANATTGGDYDGQTTASVDVELQDNDTASLFVNDFSLEVTEGADGEFMVKLNTQPSSNTPDITIRSTHTAVATVSNDGTNFAQTTTLAFNSTDWDTLKTVYVRAVEDDGAADNDTTITFTVTDYDAVMTANNVTVDVEDDDTRAVRLSAASVAVTEEEAGTGDPPDNTYTVVLDTQPTGAVTVRIASDNPDVRVNGRSPFSLTFTSSTWNTPQTVTVTAVNDQDGWHDEATLTHAVSGADYDEGVNPDSVTVNVTDNDPLGFRINPDQHRVDPPDRTNVNEGSTVTYTLWLLTPPWATSSSRSPPSVTR